MTEFRLPDDGRKVYLSPVVDLFDGKPVGWAVGTSPDARLTESSLEMACATLGEGEAPVAHTDRVLALPQNQPNAPLYPAGGAPGSRPGALPHFGRPRYLGPPPRARSTAG